MRAITGHRPNSVAAIAHELRVPLTALEAASEVLDRDLELLDQAKLRTMVASIHRRTLSMRSLLENLLCASAIEAGRLGVTPRPVDMSELIHEVADTVEPLLRRKRQEINILETTEPAFAFADANRIRQVLTNLVANAHKFAEDGTEITIEVICAAGAVRVVVSDRGPGLPKGWADRAFSPYERLGRLDSDGLGLGLWIVRSIVEAHDGGRVGASNRAGGGASFWFDLRMAELEPRSVIASPSRSKTAEGMTAA